MFSPAIERWVVSSNVRPAPEMPCLASITTSAITPARASGASAEHGRGRIAAGVGDDRRVGDLLAVQLGQPVRGLVEQVRARVRAVPLLVCLDRGEAEVGAEVDYARAELVQRADGGRGGGVRVGDDGRIQAAPASRSSASCSRSSCSICSGTR